MHFQQWNTLDKSPISSYTTADIQKEVKNILKNILQHRKNFVLLPDLHNKPKDIKPLPAPTFGARPMTEHGLSQRLFAGSQLHRMVSSLFPSVDSGMIQGIPEELCVCCSTPPARTNFQQNFWCHLFLQMSLLFILCQLSSHLAACKGGVVQITYLDFHSLNLLLLTQSQISNVVYPPPSGKYLNFQQSWCLLLSFGRHRFRQAFNSFEHSHHMDPNPDKFVWVQLKTLSN